jgi:hypothetical protein
MQLPALQSPLSAPAQRWGPSMSSPLCWLTPPMRLEIAWGCCGRQPGDSI